MSTFTSDRIFSKLLLRKLQNYYWISEVNFQWRNIEWISEQPSKILCLRNFWEWERLLNAHKDRRRRERSLLRDEDKRCTFPICFTFSLITILKHFSSTKVEIAIWRDCRNVLKVQCIHSSVHTTMTMSLRWKGFVWFRWLLAV